MRRNGATVWLAASWLVTLAVLLPQGASAQSLPSLGKGLESGAAGLMGQGLPNVASAGAANTTGMLGYCIKQKYLNNASAGSVLSRLSGRSGIGSSPDYAAGQRGQLQTGNGTFSLSGVQDQVKGKICDMVLDHAKSLL